MDVPDVQVKINDFKEAKPLMVFTASYCTAEPSVDMKGRPFVFAAAELFEKVAFLAIASNLITYLTQQLHEGTATSSINVYNWQGASFFLAILGGFIADTYWGRFWTTLNFSLSFLMGMFVLSLAETIKALKPPPCNIKLGEKCEKPTSSEVGFFWLALVLVAISFGGTAPTRASLAVDQFDKTVPTERSMLFSFPSRWFICLGCSALVAQSSIIYIQDNIGWGLGFGLPTVAYAIVVVLMFCGIPDYRHRVPTGSPLIAIAQVLVAATRNHKAHIIPLHKSAALLTVARGNQGKRELTDTCHRLENTHSLRFLDSAAVPKSSDLREENARIFNQDSTEPATNLWKQCPLSQVEDVKQVVRLLPLWLIFVPAAGVQAPVVPNQVVPMSVFWLLPQCVLMGLMEVFLTIGKLELYYKEVCATMHSLGSVLFLANMGAGNFWASAMVKLVRAVTGKKGNQQWIVNENINRCRLDYFFGFLAVQMAFVLRLYLVIAQHFEHQRAIHEIILECNATCNLGDFGPVNFKPTEEYPNACHPSPVKENIQE